MEYKIVRRLKKRMRCEAGSCKAMATWVLGKRGVEFPICEEHYNLIRKEILMIQSHNGGQATKELIEKKKEEEAKLALESEVKESEVVEEVIEVEPEAEEVWTCKYCGQTFKRSEMTRGEFMSHCRACKKEHEKC